MNPDDNFIKQLKSVFSHLNILTQKPLSAGLGRSTVFDWLPCAIAHLLTSLEVSAHQPVNMGANDGVLGNFGSQGIILGNVAIFSDNWGTDALARSQHLRQGLGMELDRRHLHTNPLYSQLLERFQGDYKDLARLQTQLRLQTTTCQEVANPE